MKKFLLTACALVTGISAFAYYGNYEHSHNDEMSGFTLIVMIAAIVLSIVILVRWWSMTKDVKLLREKFTTANQKLVYLIAIGEKEQAEKEALKMVVDRLYPIYGNSYIFTKAQYMNDAINGLVPRIKKLGLELPDYATSGEKFIDYMNTLTGKNVQYAEDNKSQNMN